MRIRVFRSFPGGKMYEMQPYHVCMKGLENAVLFRDDDDYDAMVKIICVCARRKGVRVIIYAVVSNHCHIAILARVMGLPRGRIAQILKKKDYLCE